MTASLHHRHSIRLAGYDYSLNGAYFVTLCTWQKKELFGEICNGQMQLNLWGKIVENEWLSISYSFLNTFVDDFVVMPNHHHGIIVIDQPGLMYAESERYESVKLARPAGPGKGSIGAILAQFKSRVTKQIMASAKGKPFMPGQIWQRSYYEHIIRNEQEWEKIRMYIETNPMNWYMDDENPTRSRCTNNHGW